jgi:hypothetical protein
VNFDLAFVLVDLGVPWYKTAASEMIRSAHRAFASHDMRIVHINDSATQPHPDAHGAFGGNVRCTPEDLCRFKGYFMAEYALQADRPVIFCDVDILWQHDGALSMFAEGKKPVGLLERKFPCMRYNSGVIFSRQSDPFWIAYQAAVDGLPKEVSGWWGDQFALVAATEREPGEVERVPMRDIAPAVKEMPPAPYDAPAVHFKGEAKHLMVQYARMLDGGGAFEFARPNLDKMVIDIRPEEVSPAASHAAEQAGIYQEVAGAVIGMPRAANSGFTF